MWTHAVDVALCFGWIDSKKIKIDEDTSHQFFSKRKPRSTWSRINKEKIEKLIASGEMTPAGLAVVETAKQNGSWFILDEVEDLIIPQDLQEAFEKHEGAKDFFMSLSKSNRKIMLSWIALARLPQTRQTRVEQVALQAAQKQKPV